MDADGRTPNNNQAVLPENSCRFYCNRGFWWFSQPGLLSMQLQRQQCPKLLLHFEAKFFGDFHSHGCYQSPSVSYTRGAGKAFQHKNSSPERRWIHQAKYCSWVLGVQCLECSAYTAHPLLFLVHSLLCNINMRPMCAGDTLSRCRKDIFAEPSSDMLLLLPWHDTISGAGCDVFLAVQDSSIGDLVTHSITD